MGTGPPRKKRRGCGCASTDPELVLLNKWHRALELNRNANGQMKLRNFFAILNSRNTQASRNIWRYIVSSLLPELEIQGIAPQRCGNMKMIDVLKNTRPL